jgi:hypothetical protein
VIPENIISESATAELREDRRTRTRAAPTTILDAILQSLGASAEMRVSDSLR